MALPERGKRIGQADKDDTTRIEELERRKIPDPAEFVYASTTIFNPPGGITGSRVVIPHTWAVMGELAVPVGDASYLPGMFVPTLTTGQTATLLGARYRINGGTSATMKVQAGGSDVTGLTGLSVTTTNTTTLLPTGGFSLTSEQYVQIVVTAVSSSPTNLSFTIFVRYTF